MDQPIAEVRATLGVGPGGNVDWEHPLWNGKDTEENRELARLGAQRGRALEV